MVMVLLEDMAEFGEFNEVYAAWLEGTILPARAAYGVKELPAGAKVEVGLYEVPGRIEPSRFDYSLAIATME